MEFRLWVRYICFRYFSNLYYLLIFLILKKSFDFRVDALTIHDGKSHTSPMLGNPYCGDSLPPSQISSSNHLLFHLHSNHINTGTGFKLEYDATSKNPNKIDICSIVLVSRLLIKKTIIFYIWHCLVYLSLLDTISFISSRL